MDKNVLDIFLSPFLRIYNIYNIDDLFLHLEKVRVVIPALSRHLPF